MTQMQTLTFVAPAEIETRSFQIIGDELAARGIKVDPETEPVVKRVIHTTADFEYAETLRFSEGVVPQSVLALRDGCHVVTDTSMVAAGINKRVLGRFGGQVHTFVADADVAAEAKTRGITRSAVAMERAAALPEPPIYAIGNAPTALVQLADLVQAGKAPMPRLVIGVPVGFVNVVESKELIMGLGCPYIVAVGRKGGSNVAASIVNALLYLASDGARD
ncbi:Cobalt-precorrin-8X methylmutase [Slackia heliotrinireducens]|jgi:precorrin-8X/cobalt-precorrin-8 methylmutase|uniref:Precorrin-8X methylmutase n=1 Tax=Slackia heliotrinireducens (strain ATCC 29202 / DSM 20476 / NCTC 11029 / RHS 1) TaxID=471855 RepID=C7N889_SLAHD|nr:precorrin-8X methylmutase [Slackia heliotrinireducens]ACV23124.1 precorrin-8X methylmutase [Slackia heliotrinireducens DSM 20476]VEH02142.1 Cobalt-precorrin-8X methylmutase [Slackia heliotrinireducens]